tara:strand:+ start:566 stop:718 length:153 start_codon:yes stop_codon:yes gene_type:complete
MSKYLFIILIIEINPSVLLKRKNSTDPAAIKKIPISIKEVINEKKSNNEL